MVNVLVPRAVVEPTVHVGARGATESWRTRRTGRRTRRACWTGAWAWATTHLAAHVGRDVGRSAALVITKGQIAHVQLISHDCSWVVVRVLGNVDCFSVFQVIVSLCEVIHLPS